MKRPATGSSGIAASRAVSLGAAAVLAAALVAGALAVACAPAPSAAGSASAGVASPATASPPTAAPPTTVPQETAAPEPVELTVFAAASLRDALDALIVAYADVAPEVTITISTGASSTLRAQIEQGAPADLFLSADTTNPAALALAGLTTGDAKLIAGNRLAIIVPTANPAALATPADLARPGVKVIAAGDAVPITVYSDQLVARLGSQAGDPSGFAAAYEANIVSREEDVQAVVAKIELGEGDAAIVYRTDAQADGVTTIPIPPDADVTASYAGVLLGASAHLMEARAFLDWITGADAQGIMASFGFSPPGT